MTPLQFGPTKTIPPAAGRLSYLPLYPNALSTQLGKAGSDDDPCLYPFADALLNNVRNGWRRHYDHSHIRRFRQILDTPVDLEAEYLILGRINRINPAAEAAVDQVF